MSEAAAGKLPLAGARWVHASRELRERIEAWSAVGGPAGTLFAESQRRRLILLEPSETAPEAGALLLKHFRRPRPRASAPLKRWLGRSSPEREYRALTRMRARELPVPQALGLAQLPDGEWLLVMRHLEGRPLADALAAADVDSGALLQSLGDTLAKLHRAGFAHGDLHIGNVLDTPKGPALLDFQAAGRASGRAVVRDIGSMDFSLAHHGVGDALRSRFRNAALSERREARSEVDRAARRHADAYYRSRTRRSTREGRQYAPARIGEWSGIRVASFSERSLQAALDAHRHAIARGGPAVQKCDHRSRVSAVTCEGRNVIVKEVTKGGFAKQWADAFRGSPARRAWLGGHGLLVRGIDAARPLAFVELRQRLGPSASLLVMEDVCPARPAAEFLREDDGGLAALCKLVTALHEAGVVHGDLQAHHIYLSRDTQGVSAALIDLEAVRFPRRLRDAERVKALAELNASLADDLVSSRERRDAFDRYAAKLPFRGGAEGALQRIVSQSRERGHLWRGEGCDDGTPSPIRPSER